MRSMKWAVAVAVAASSFLGCGNSQPSIYRVAIDPLIAPTTCYRTGNAPTTNPDTTSNIVDEKQWVIWEGIEEDVYLEPGTINYDMGEARNVTISGDAIRGSKNDDGEYVFTSQRKVIVSDSTTTAEIHTTTATYTIEKLGKTLEGSLSLTSTCEGSGCNASPSCSISLPFSGRQIDGDRYFQYGSGSGG